jgi:hypothetical protein
VGDGVADDTAAIQAAIAAIGSDERTLYFPPGTYYIGTTGLTFPVNVTDKFDRGAKLTDNGDNNIDVTINGPVSCDASGQIFDWTGTGSNIIFPNYYGTPITPQMWGAVGDGVTNDAPAFQSWAAAFTTGMIGRIPPASYIINGSIAFAGVSLITITAYGAILTQTNTGAISTVDLNSAAQADESVVQYGIYWSGGLITNQTDYAGNSNIGIRAIGIYQSRLTDITIRRCGDAGLDYCPRDTTWCDNLQFPGGANINDICIRVPNFTTVNNNPQVCKFIRCGLSGYNTYGFVSYKEITEFTFMKCQGVANTNGALYYISAGDGANSKSVSFFHCLFEGASASTYIEVYDGGNSRSLYNLVIDTCNFDGADNVVLEADYCRDIQIDKNTITQNNTGIFVFSDDVREANFGSNSWIGLSSIASDAITYPNARREEIRLAPCCDVKDGGQAFVTGYGPATLSTGGPTQIDLINLAVPGTTWGSYYSKIIAPLAWILRVSVRDSGSAGGTAHAEFYYNNSNPDVKLQAYIDISGIPNNTWRQQDVVVPCFRDGSIYLTRVATGADTMELSITAIGALW